VAIGFVFRLAVFFLKNISFSAQTKLIGDFINNRQRAADSSVCASFYIVYFVCSERNGWMEKSWNNRKAGTAEIIGKPG
jgi:hypothetical protein